MFRAGVCLPQTVCVDMWAFAVLCALARLPGAECQGCSSHASCYGDTYCASGHACYACDYVRNNSSCDAIDGDCSTCTKRNLTTYNGSQRRRAQGGSNPTAWRIANGHVIGDHWVMSEVNMYASTACDGDILEPSTSLVSHASQSCPSQGACSLLMDGYVPDFGGGCCGWGGTKWAGDASWASQQIEGTWVRYNFDVGVVVQCVSLAQVTSDNQRQSQVLLQYSCDGSAWSTLDVLSFSDFDSLESSPVVGDAVIDQSTTLCGNSPSMEPSPEPSPANSGTSGNSPATEGAPCNSNGECADPDGIHICICSVDAMCTCTEAAALCAAATACDNESPDDIGITESCFAATSQYVSTFSECAACTPPVTSSATVCPACEAAAGAALSSCSEATPGMEPSPTNCDAESAACMGDAECLALMSLGDMAAIMGNTLGAAMYTCIMSGQECGAE
eukprot:COSAG02_NODE_12707_length_1506_cov_1.584932_1_plen_447_part_10